MRGKQTIYLMYYPLFLVRRIVFVAIPTFLYNYPYYQVQLLIFLTSLYISAYMGTRPHWDSKKMMTESFNEMMTLLACYHLICFSEFNLDAEAQFSSGYSFIGVIFVVVIVNVGIVTHRWYYGFRRKKLEMQVKKYIKTSERAMEIAKVIFKKEQED